MSRDQRAEDNWALLHAQHLAEQKGYGLAVVFCLVPKFLGATLRQYGFMLKGLREVEAKLQAHNIAFHLLLGDAKNTLPAFVAEHKVGACVVDFSPLRVPLAWAAAVADKLDALRVPLFQVDAHNVVPCWYASDKKETAARTIRPKIQRLLPEFLTEFPRLRRMPKLETGDAAGGGSRKRIKTEATEGVDWAAALETLTIDRTVTEVAWCKPGAAAGMKTLASFCESRLKLFDTKRNDPTVAALSNMSPYVHFGQVGAQRCVLDVRAYARRKSVSSAGFVEELVVRRELADNFCFYQPQYDSLDGAANWARESLELHASDPREYTYTRSQLEEGQTHDDLWNAAQKQMVIEGKMHGFLRMYWAKKILEWTPSPAVALETAIYLNDRYELDGRDPNGYVGCAWSIMGTHDMGWKERPIFGKIRFMNYNGCKRKFDVAAFVDRYQEQQGGGGGSGSA
eukprot:g2869.t1